MRLFEAVRRFDRSWRATLKTDSNPKFGVAVFFI